MSTSLKCQYGLRAMFELARHYGEGQIGIGEIAEVQAIPQRFLENIMNVLRRGGFVESRRGRHGGFFLARKPEEISLGDIVKFIDGEIYSIDCEGEERRPRQCRLRGACVFLPVWREAKAALESVYYSKTLQDLLDAEKALYPSDYVI